MNRIANVVLLGILSTGSLAAITGCTHTTYSRKDDAISLTVTPSATTIMQNETVTFLPRTENTLGRNAKLDWKTTGGKLSTKGPEPVAQVTFDNAGTYSVDGILMIDGKEETRSTTVITVKPLPTP